MFVMFDTYRKASGIVKWISHNCVDIEVNVGDWLMSEVRCRFSEILTHCQELKYKMKWIILPGKMIMFSTLNNNFQSYTVICSCISIHKQVYLNIKLNIEFQAGSDNNVTGHVTFLESSVWGSSSKQLIWRFRGGWQYMPNM